MATPIWQWSAVDTAAAIRDGRATSEEVVQAHIDRMHAANSAINAVVVDLSAQAIEAARAADRALAQGATPGKLQGVPVTIKINIDVEGQANSNGVVAFKDNIAPGDSPVTANLKKAGAIIIGMTNAPEFSMRGFTDNPLHGPTLNPWDSAITCGGSSGGAGASIATGIGAIAHGNDIGGSVRIPAYCNGVVGLRAGFARIPAFNPTAANNGRPVGGVLMAVQGPHTRTVRDARLALEVMSRGDRRDWRWNDVPMQGPPPARPIKVAIVPEFPGCQTHPAQAAAVRRAGKHLQGAGYVVEEVMPPDLELGVDLWQRIIATESFHSLWPTMQKMGDPDGIAAMKCWLELHKPTDLPTYMGALTEREGMLYRWMTFMLQWPLVVFSTLADLPPKQVSDTTVEGQRKVMNSMRPALIAPLLGLPGLAVPVGSHDKLRTGVQIMAMRNREDLCLDAGEVIEAAEGVVTPIDPEAA